MHVWGHYEDDLVNEDGVWRSQRRDLCVTGLNLTDLQEVPRRFERSEHQVRPRGDASPFGRREEPTDGWQSGLRVWSETYCSAIRLHPNAAPVVAAGAHEHSDYLAMSEQVHTELVAHGWPPAHGTMVAAAKFLLPAAATAAAGDTARGRVGRAGDLPRSMPTQLEQFAGTIDRASFTLALESLILGLESMYESVKRIDPAGIPAERLVTRPCGPGRLPSRRESCLSVKVAGCRVCHA